MWPVPWFVLSLKFTTYDIKNIFVVLFFAQGGSSAVSYPDVLSMKLKEMGPF